jgi:hypothetical protein
MQQQILPSVKSSNHYFGSSLVKEYIVGSTVYFIDSFLIKLSGYVINTQRIQTIIRS